MSNRLQVRGTAELAEFLVAQLQGWSRTRIKKRLQAGCVLVNGAAVTRHDHALAAGDQVEVLALGKPAARGNQDFTLKAFPGLNHLFQHCESGLVTEYGEIEETISTEVLDTITDWIAARFLTD
ncbi:MAG TPA: hypothetical protein VGC54_03230 [Planctomycetota bacterium]